MPQNKITKRLVFAYASAVIIIAILILTAQFLIQSTLYQEIDTRALASTMALQELRTQAIFRNALLAVLTIPQQGQYNTLNVDPVKALAKNLTDVEKTQKLLTGPDTPTEVSTPLKNLQNDFDIMDSAGHQVLIDLKAGNNKAAGQQVGILWQHEQKYLIGTYGAYQDLTVQADAYVNAIRMLEFVLCLISLAVLAIEFFAIVRPAIADYNKALEDLEQVKTTTGSNTPPSQANNRPGTSN